MSNKQYVQDYTLTLSCKDRAGIVAAVAGYIANNGGFILDSQQYADIETERFFMRVEFNSAYEAPMKALDQLRAGFSSVSEKFQLDWELALSATKPKILIAVSKSGHCLNDLLHRWRIGSLPVDIAGVVSNHPGLRELTEWHGISYHYLPVDPENKAEQEAKMLSLFATSGASYLILARYMQVLSAELARGLSGRCINIHHSFLPSFMGARPYLRARARGVKLIGATAHFVTSDLDEGPIIEQDVERVDHRATESDLITIGRDIEARVLARAVCWAAERRVFLNGHRTVVFR